MYKNDVRSGPFFADADTLINKIKTPIGFSVSMKLLLGAVCTALKTNSNINSSIKNVLANTARFYIAALSPSKMLTKSNLKPRLVLSCARKYSKCMKTGHLASTSGYCSRELKRDSEMDYSAVDKKAQTFLELSF